MSALLCELKIPMVIAGVLAVVLTVARINQLEATHLYLPPGEPLVRLHLGGPPDPIKPPAPERHLASAPAK